MSNERKTAFSLTRRHAMGALAGGAVLSAMGPDLATRTRPAFGQGAAPAPSRSAVAFDLKVAQTDLSPDGGKVVRAVTVNGTLPGPEIRAREGDLVRLQLTNGLAEDVTSIHWHGLLVPSGMDGVPGLSMTALKPGEVFLYEYVLKQSGTFWYHSHSGLQEQLGLLGAFVIEPRQERLAYDRDYVVMLSDWLYSDPYAVVPRLRGESGAAVAAKESPTGPMAMVRDGGAMAPMHGGGGSPMPGAGDSAGAMPGMAMPAAAVPGTRMEGGGMAGMGDGPDLADITYDAFLLNGAGNANPWTCQARPGERVRLRVINAAASTFMRFMVDGHSLTVVSADGAEIEPVETDNIFFGMAETYDVIVTVKESGSFTIRAESQDGTGQALGILHTPDVKPVADLAKPKWGPRQLSYADLRSVEETSLPDGPDRAYDLALTGDMAKYIWSINGQVFPDADPLIVSPGQRVRVKLTNNTGMWHPMHLHGHYFRVLGHTEGDRLAPLKHTVSLAPREVVEIDFLADNPGAWFFHCHNAYHLEAGMARVWRYRA